CEQAWHMYYLLLPSLERRQALIGHLKSRGILAVFHYMPLDLSPYASSIGIPRGGCPVTSDVSDRILRLPFYNSLSKVDQRFVTDTIMEFRL
ncbi:MAG TPA: DegT/DnrJ/EryC1/StrS family aminotransferase, partial [Opitutaceae bacterium]|nr:DegT/DnrJ/EryC1/StrS family aminotransferase [Opitutaceae bacterium]